MFYDNFVKICKEHGVSPSKAAVDAGLSKSTVTKWKNIPDSRPTGTALTKIAAYFGITIAELLGEDQQKENPPSRLEPTERESRILEALRSKSPAEQKALLTLLGISED